MSSLPIAPGGPAPHSAGAEPQADEDTRLAEYHRRRAAHERGRRLSRALQRAEAPAPIAPQGPEPLDYWRRSASYRHHAVICAYCGSLPGESRVARERRLDAAAMAYSLMRPWPEIGVILVGASTLPPPDPLALRLHCALAATPRARQLGILPPELEPGADPGKSVLADIVRASLAEGDRGSALAALRLMRQGWVSVTARRSERTAGGGRTVDELIASLGK